MALTPPSPAPLADPAGADATRLAPQPPWSVVHTRSRQEKALAGFLDAAGIQFFLPLVRTVRYYGRRKFHIATPLFPGYLFLRAGRDESFIAERSGRAARVIPVADQPALQRDLLQIRSALDRGAPLAPSACIRAEQRVRVIAGPFRGLRGLVERHARDDRLILRVDVLGRAAQLEIDRGLLEPLD